MKTSTFSLLAKIACIATVLSAVACSSTASKDPSTNTKPQTSKSAVSASAADQEEPDDKVTCSVDTDCDSDERCESGRCAGLDGDTE